jgi:hypothetical protein
MSTVVDVLTKSCQTSLNISYVRLSGVRDCLEKVAGEKGFCYTCYFTNRLLPLEVT